MKTLMIAASALALSTPALAQMEPAAPAQPAQSTTQSTTTTTQTPAATQPAADPAATTTTESTTTTTATAADPKALIASEYPTYDKDGNGSLDKAEFAAWMGALKAKTGAKPMSAAETTKWTDGAFATADADKSKSISLAELQTYLTKGA